MRSTSLYPGAPVALNAAGRPSVHLDLENPADREKLADAELYLSGHEDKLVILDEVQRAPEWFQALRELMSLVAVAGG